MTDRAHHTGTVSFSDLHCSPCGEMSFQRADVDECKACGLLGENYVADLCEDCSLQRFWIRVSPDLLVMVERGKIVHQIPANTAAAADLGPKVLRHLPRMMTCGGMHRIIMFTDPAGYVYESPKAAEYRKRGGEYENWIHKGGKYRCVNAQYIGPVSEDRIEFRVESKPEPIRVAMHWTFTCEHCLKQFDTTELPFKTVALCRACRKADVGNVLSDAIKSFSTGGVVKAENPDHRPRSTPVESQLKPAVRANPSWDPEGLAPELHDVYLPEKRTWRDRTISEVIPFYGAAVTALFFAITLVVWVVAGGWFPWMTLAAAAYWNGWALLKLRSNRRKAHAELAARADAAYASESS